MPPTPRTYDDDSNPRYATHRGLRLIQQQIATTSQDARFIQCVVSAKLFSRPRSWPLDLNGLHVQILHSNGEGECVVGPLSHDPTIRSTITLLESWFSAPSRRWQTPGGPAQCGLVVGHMEKLGSSCKAHCPAAECILQLRVCLSIQSLIRPASKLQLQC